MPSRSEVEAYHLLQQQLVDAGVADVSDLMRLPNRQAILEAYPDIVDPYLAASAELSASWYEELVPNSGFEVRAVDPVDRTVLEKNAAWALAQPNPEKSIVGAVDRQIRNAGRDTIQVNARREGVAWRREASSTACGFCQMLTTRGGVYYSAKSAGYTANVGLRSKEGGYHDFCSCIVIAERVGSPYEPPAYAKNWEAEYRAAAKTAKGDLDKIANIMRPSQSADAIEARKVVRTAEALTRPAAQRAALAKYGDAKVVKPGPKYVKPELPPGSGPAKVPHNLSREEANAKLDALLNKIAPADTAKPVKKPAAPKPAAPKPVEPKPVAADPVVWRVDEFGRLTDKPAPAAGERQAIVHSDPAALVDEDGYRIQSWLDPPDELTQLLDDAERAMAAGKYDVADELFAKSEKVEQKLAAKQRRLDKQVELDSVKNDRVAQLVADGWDGVEAESQVWGISVEQIRKRDFISRMRADNYEGAGFDELITAKYKELVYEQFVAATAATQEGAMIKIAFRQDFNPRDLWTVTDATARKVMSNEMAEWFDRNGKVTRAGLRRQVLDGQGSLSSVGQPDFHQ